LALALAASTARGQNADLGDLGLRTGQQTVPPDALSPPGQTTDQAVSREAKPTKSKKASARLPPLQHYRGAERLGLRGGAPESEPGPSGEAPQPGPTIAAIPAPPPLRKIPVEEKPYDPLGVRVGDLDLKPYIEEDVGWASNPFLIPGAVKGSAFDTTEVGGSLQSDWSRSDVHGDLKAGYTDYFTERQASAPYASSTLGGRYDISKDLSLDAEGRFNLSEQNQSSLGLVSTTNANNVVLTQVTTYGATAGGAQKFGDFTLALHGTFDRLIYQDVVLPGVGDLAMDDYNDWGLLVRASYRLSEAVSPFVELGVDKRIYDSVTDADGYERDSIGGTGKVGATLSFSKMLNGEMSIGYGAREYQDPRLPNASAPLLNGSLIWSLTPLTTVTLKAQSALADAVIAGDSADVTHSYAIDVSHALTRQITLSASAGYATDRYIGASLRDSTTTLALKAEYHLTRDVVLKASATHEQYVSSAPNSNYTADIFLLGVRLQR
jgi:hypothetical protein